MAPNSSACNHLTSPEGLILLKNRYQIGPKLASGAQGAIHVVVDTATRQATSWVVKVTMLPSSPTSKKASDKALSCHAATLNWENLAYRVHLVRHVGTLLPQIPLVEDRIPAYCVDLQGFRCLVMQRMEAPLYTVLSQVIRAAAPGTKIELGVVAARLLHILEVVHSHNILYVDVKPENFMIAPTTATGTQMDSLRIENVADRLRILDFGLSRLFRGASGHRSNDGNQEIEGTPLYCSLQAHEGHTLSRRDDVEAMLYVICEIVILARAIQEDVQQNYEATNIPSYLPWSQEKSDEALGGVKKEQVTNKKSTFYKRMPPDAAPIIQKCIDIIQKTAFTATPDYRQLQELVLSIRIDAPSRKLLAASKSASKQRTRSRLEASPSSGSGFESGSEPETTKPRKKQLKKSPVENCSPMDVDDTANSPDENKKQVPLPRDSPSARKFIANHISLNTKKNSSHVAKSKSGSNAKYTPATVPTTDNKTTIVNMAFEKKKHFVRFTVQGGPHEGTQLRLEENGGGPLYVIADANGAITVSNTKITSHVLAKLELLVFLHGKLPKVQVSSTKQLTETMNVGGRKLFPASKAMAISGDDIKIRNTTIHLFFSRA